jgi:hypothetical protein
VIGLAAFVLPLAAGWCFVAALLRRHPMKPAWAASALTFALGAGGGIAASSVLFFLLALCGVASPVAILLLDLALLAASLAALWRTRGKAPEPPASAAPPAFRWNWLLALALAAGLALVLSGLISTAAANPLGDWDAWAIWNLRAKFLAGPGAAWKGALSPLLAHSHPDYPLLSSGFVAMVWKAFGRAAPWVPQLTGFLFLGMVFALLAGALSILRGLTAALLAGFVLLVSTSFLFLATMQYADLPLSFYYLAALALLMLGSAKPAAAPLCLALSGTFASFAAWTKNEGVPFVVLLLLCVVAVEWRALGLRPALASAKRYVLGAAPVLALVACFKLFLAPAADPLLRQSAAQVAHKLADPGRYAQIGKALAFQVYHFGLPSSHPLLLLAILALALRFRIDQPHARALRASALALALVFASYCGVYVITTNDLAWHLDTSLARLYGQVWPGVLLLAFLVLNAPGAAGPSPKPKGAARK